MRDENLTTMSRSILVLYAHPRTEASRANRRLKRVAEGIEDVTVVDLYATYPTYDIDIDAEQARVSEHDVLIFQHPVYWYSSPALVKEWIDLVLEWGWAYGPGGLALDGTIYLHAVTAGGDHAAFESTGQADFDLRDLFAPFEQTALLCKMRYLPPFALFDANDGTEAERLDAHASGYARLLRALRDETIDIEAAATVRSLAPLYCAAVGTDN